MDGDGAAPLGAVQGRVRQTAGIGGYAAAMINFRFMASDVWTTEETVAKIAAAK